MNSSAICNVTMETTGIGVFFHKAHKLIKESELIAIITTIFGTFKWKIFWQLFFVNHGRASAWRQNTRCRHLPSATELNS